EQGEQGSEQEEDEGLGQDRRREVAAAYDEGRADEAHHCTFSWPMAAAVPAPAIATKASCRPGRSMARVSIPAPPSIKALSSGSGPPSGSSNTNSPPSRRAFEGMASRHGPSLARVRRR